MSGDQPPHIGFWQGVIAAIFWHLPSPLVAFNRWLEKRKGSPQMRDPLSDKYIRGRGIEIGGRHCPMHVPKGALVSYVDRLSLEELKQDKDVKVVENEIVVDDAETLEKFPDDSLDFIIANHVYEHTRNPLRTLFVWRQKLRKGGIVYAAIPEKTLTFDSPRPVTPFGHLLSDLLDGPNTNDESHYREWFATIDGLAGEVLSAKVAHAVQQKENIHFHVWDRAAMREIFDWAKDQGIFELLEMVTHGGEEICILKSL